MIVPRSIKYQDCLAYKTYTCTCMSIGYVATARIAHYVSGLEFFLTKQKKKKKKTMYDNYYNNTGKEGEYQTAYVQYKVLHTLYNYVHVIVIRS